MKRAAESRFFHTITPAGAENTENGQPSKARKKGEVWRVFLHAKPLPES